MKIFMIGGTGLLGSEAAKELIARGHEVTTIARAIPPSDGGLPQEMKVAQGNYLEMTEEELREKFQGYDGFIFAAGIDERVISTPPVYELYKKHNVYPIRKLLKIAKECGVRHSVICGSYLAYLAKKWPEKELTRWHPYIRSRIDQENAAMEYADENFDVSVLELPYIFGTQPGRKPVWVFLIETISKMKNVTLYIDGGTAVVTVRQVGQAIAGAMERNRGGHCYPVGYYNMSWKEMVEIMQRCMGHTSQKLIYVPRQRCVVESEKLMAKQKSNNLEGGMDAVKLADVQYDKAYIDKAEGSDFLGVTEDDINKAIAESVESCMDFINNKVEMKEMKAD